VGEGRERGNAPSPLPREIVPTSRDICFAKISRGKFPSHYGEGINCFLIVIRRRMTIKKYWIPTSVGITRPRDSLPPPLRGVVVHREFSVISSASSSATLPLHRVAPRLAQSRDSSRRYPFLCRARQSCVQFGRVSLIYQNCARCLR